MYEILFPVIVLISMVFFVLLAIWFTKTHYKKIINEMCTHTAQAIKTLISQQNSKDITGGAPYQELASFYQEMEMLRSRLKDQEKYRTEALAIANSVALNRDLSELFEDLMPKILNYTNSTCGAFYLANHATNRLEIKASLGFSKSVYNAFDITVGEGLIGSAAMFKEIRIFRDVPEDTVYNLRTFLGTIKPKNLMVIPIYNQDEMMGVLVLATIYDYPENQKEITDLIVYYVGIAVANGINYERSHRLTNELRFQNTLIQNLNEELEKKVKSRTLLLNNIIDSIKDYAIFAMDRNGIVLAFNKGAEKILGYRESEVLGQHVNVLYQNQNIRPGKIQEKLDMAAKNGRYEENGWWRKKDGSKYYCNTVLFAMYDENKDLIGYTNVTKDTTNIKNAENSLGFEEAFARRIFDSSNQALVMTDAEGNILLVNQKAVDVMEFSFDTETNICDLFLDSNFLKKNLLDVANRYSKGEWKVVTKQNKKTLWFNVNVIMDTHSTDLKLIIHIYE